MVRCSNDPPKRARSIDRAEQLVEQVPVAVLHVDEVEARVGREHGRVDVGLDELVELVVREHDGRLGRHPPVEHGMVVGDQWLRRAGRAGTNGRSA